MKIQDVPTVTLQKHPYGGEMNSEKWNASEFTLEQKLGIAVHEQQHGNWENANF